MNNDKINSVEAMFVVLLVAMVEVLEVILSFIPIAGDIVKWFINVIVWIPVQLWLRMKGARGDIYVAASIIEFIPLLNALPIKTTMLITTIILHNRGIGKLVSVTKKAR